MIDIRVIPIAAASKDRTGGTTPWATAAITVRTRVIGTLMAATRIGATATAATRIGEIGATASIGIGVTGVIETGGLVRSAALFGGTIIASGFAIADRPD